MIKSIHFKNFKILRDSILPLSQFTLIVGPNGSGKSTAMRALSFAVQPDELSFRETVTVGLEDSVNEPIEIVIEWDGLADTPLIGRTKWIRRANGAVSRNGLDFDGEAWQGADPLKSALRDSLRNFRIFSFDPEAISAPIDLYPRHELAPDGANLAGVLDTLRDSEPERFEALNEELQRWLPEFDRILFITPSQGKRAFLLRTRIGGHKIPAADLSHGTLLALAFLTLAYIPSPPSIVCFEEPERGIHPRLLREIRDGMYRLSYPEAFNEKREPVQVIATTHSPFLLDLYKDHPEEIVIAHKDRENVRFERLSEKPDYDEFLRDTPLGEVWYSGVLGGVPNHP